MMEQIKKVKPFAVIKMRRFLCSLFAFMLVIVFLLTSCVAKTEASGSSGRGGSSGSEGASHAESKADEGKTSTSAEQGAEKKGNEAKEQVKPLSFSFVKAAPRTDIGGVSQEGDSSFSEKQKKIVDKMQEFAQRLRAEFPADHVFSPFSYYLALAAVRPGLRAEALEKLNKILLPEGMSDEDYSIEIRSLLEQNKRQAEPAYLSKLLILGRKDLTWNQDYVNRAAALGAHIAQVDFQNRATYEDLNEWIAEQTNRLIYPYFEESRIEEQIKKEDQVWMILNTLYFKSFWLNPFNESQTKKEDFEGDSGKKTVPMMEQSLHLEYLETDTFQALRLPYSNGANLTLLLPKRKADSKAPSSAAEAWSYLEEVKSDSASWKTSYVHLRLPRWKQSASLDLKKTLKTMGLESFTDTLGATAYFDPPISLALDKVLQRIEFKLDEKGTEAAALTEIGAVRSSAPLEAPDKIEMFVNRPFVFSLDYAGLPLFEGSIRDIHAD